jgi:predicted RNA-binding protein with PUA-like domain
MAHWLLKTEPGDYSWDRLVADGRTAWDGVRNYQAARNMKDMKRGDEAFFYRSVKDPAVVGIMRVVKEAYPDPARDEGTPWVLVEFEPVEKLPEEVSLAAIKAEPAFAGFKLVRQSRLSVMPVDDQHWRLICRMAGRKS